MSPMQEMKGYAIEDGTRYIILHGDNDEMEAMTTVVVAGKNVFVKVVTTMIYIIVKTMPKLLITKETEMMQAAEKVLTG